MKSGISLVLLWLVSLTVQAQLSVDLAAFSKKNGATARVDKEKLEVSWPVQGADRGKIIISLAENTPLFTSIQLSHNRRYQVIATELQPEFVLTIGKRDLISQNGWNIFFDKVPNKPFKSYRVGMSNRKVEVSSVGSRTKITVGGLQAADFNGNLEVTLYHGSPLLNIAAVLATKTDSTAIVYDAGLVSEKPAWQRVGWSATNKQYQSTLVSAADTSRNQAVKYRTILGESAGGSLAVFPAPHQYFYPLDEAFNLKFVWFGSKYRKVLPGYGLGIRQDLYGDKRYVPWFNAPPGTAQRLNFYCLLGTGKAEPLLDEVKRYTHQDTYAQLPGYKTMASHFHNEYVMNVMLPGKEAAGTPEFVRVFKSLGLDIVHLGEFHYTAHPKGPDEQRLREMAALFELCQKSSDKDFLLLPGEEPNEFLGGHWLELFPKPVYWVMAKKPGTPFVQENTTYGRVYHVGDKTEMLKLLEAENGLAWTAHARTKGSTGYPDAYKNEAFFKSDHFMGAAWKALPADLSQPRLGKRTLDLLDDFNNWGVRKHIIAEADLFTVNFENEMYAHLNVNYLPLSTLPDFKTGWQPVVDVLKKGSFFSSTGEVLIPQFTVNGKGAGETVTLQNPAKTTVEFTLNWTFPMAFAEIISGDGQKVYRQQVDLLKTTAFGKQAFHVSADLTNRKWVRLEAWDVAANGAFTQTVYLTE
ncbi:hypothetical protein MUN82_02880 [Hymenobacter aerilatus]|uniref:DUF5060 domain-containing protein n=1 Tax=Hymenobacter aerilatus TaxID=2932251 RepID=A0A8T9T229_9BACT|nr:hypothetical protein [Hymenobacter aerilatus]UOR06049.1 hypothetical protein MUN82_02880 [Hymenobacter aerilatus]